jgi:adenine phosphoribosyltransferase
MVERLRNAIRDVHGFPKEGIVFKDITPILGDGALFRGSIDLLCETAGGAKVDKVEMAEKVAKVFTKTN